MHKLPHEIDVHLGRFAPYHEGHKLVTDSLVKKRNQKKPLVIVGSSNVFEGRPPKDTRERELMLRTPYTAGQREEMIRRLFGEDVEVLHLPDTHPDPTQHANSSGEWLKSIRTLEERNNAKFTFAGGAIEDLGTLQNAFPVMVTVDRKVQGRGINATHIRRLLKDGQREALHEFMDPRIIPIAIDYFHENLRIIGA